ncbi:hypothetical protein K474DRAFT_1768808 [Panus rudis PR-1116 ss-1]|nr:hypothetical protein K474DRAFT_1768808 [Panus rudis PR-1116 ss-1]
MSSREPLWYCHECHAEMRPLMVPDPHCASCNGTFVEKIENPSDDPREFQAAGPALDDEGPFSPAQFMLGLTNLLNMPPPPPRTQQSGRSDNTGQTTGGSGGTNTNRTNSGFTIRFERPSGGPVRTIISGPPPQATGDRPDRIPLLSEFLSGAAGGANGERGRDPMDGPLVFQYLLSMLAQGRNGGEGFPPFFPGFMPPGAENGRMGDYVLTQEALDQIISQIMENSTPHPVPASEEIMRDLPRTTLAPGCASSSLPHSSVYFVLTLVFAAPLLEKDCAVCKDQFQLDTEDPAEQTIVTLPCHHPFHEPCIMPWLKQSGTCPVCRYELVPQPQAHGANNQGQGGPNGNNGGDSGNGNGDGNQNGGLFNGLFNLMNSLNSNNNNSNSNHDNNSSNNHSGSSGSGSGSSGSNQPPTPRDIPGSWAEDVD